MATIEVFLAVLEEKMYKKWRSQHEELNIYKLFLRGLSRLLQTNSLWPLLNI
jgi:hypothetical protein